MDKFVADVIRTSGREQGTPNSVVEAVLKNVLPSIRLFPQHPQAGEETRVGGCRIGGAPDLPAGIDWPRLSTESGPSSGKPLSFLIQVNLADVAFADLDQLLPKSGMLYFFFHLDEDGLNDIATVLFTRDTDLRQTTAPLDLSTDEVYTSYNLVPQLEWTVPSPYDLGIPIEEHLELWDELEDRVAAAQGYQSANGYGPGYAAHRLLGHAQFIQANGMGEEYRLLLQVSSDAGLSQQGHPESGIGRGWHDCGRIYYLTGKEALMAQRFKETFVSVECA
jgi:uncharacterized protein YwqG